MIHKYFSFNLINVCLGKFYFYLEHHLFEIETKKKKLFNFFYLANKKNLIQVNYEYYKLIFFFLIVYYKIKNI